MITTSFSLLKTAQACRDRYQHLARVLGGVNAYGADTPITILQILDANGLDDALWALRATARTEESATFSRLLACDYAERGLPAWQAMYPNDHRPAEAIRISRAYAAGEATDAELAEASREAADAAWTAWTAWAAWAAWAAAAAWAAWAARAAAAAWAAAWAEREGEAAAERAWQEARLREALAGARNVSAGGEAK